MQYLRAFLAGYRARVAAGLAGQTPGLRAQLRGMLGGVAGLYTVHTLFYVWPQPWFIEDSAISFAYARHFVEGEGLVAFPGGERVEGYSNALWTLLCAIFYALKVEPWISTKVMGWGFGLVALFASWGLVRRMLPTHRDSLLVLAPPTLLAASTQFVMWNSSGLENSLFCALLGVAAWRLAVEVEEDRGTPWSALALFGLTMTRPDGIAYAAVGGFARVCGTLAQTWRARKEGGSPWTPWRDLVAWVAMLGVPWVAYNAWRYSYFAWEWPNTYYAKEKPMQPFNWGGGGWKYVKDYSTSLGVVWALPLLVAGAVGWGSGVARWRSVLVPALVLPLALLVAWDGRAGLPPALLGSASLWWGAHWNELRVGWIVVMALVAGLATFGRPGWVARGMLWASFCAGVFFCIWSGGDWMKGYRWFSLTSVPMFTLLGAGLIELAASLPRADLRMGRVGTLAQVVAGVLVLALGAPNIWATKDRVESPETQPRDVRKRVNYMTWVKDRLGLEEVTLLEVDMGAHLWYTDWRVADLAGLVDVPVSRHKWQKAFVGDYIFDEVRPDFAHVHGSWARTSKVSAHPRWQQEYVEIPGFPSGRTNLHVGNHVRRSYLVGRDWSGPADRGVTFGTGESAVTMLGWSVPAPDIVPGAELYVDTAWAAPGRKDGFRVLLFLSQPETGALHVLEVAAAYDWLAVHRWKAGEYGQGRFSVKIPASLPQGTYELGFAVLDTATGEVLAYRQEGADLGAEGDPSATPPPPAGNAVAKGDTAPQPRYLAGEWFAPAAVRLVTQDTARTRAEARLADVTTASDAAQCEAAHDAWRNARRHQQHDTGWQQRNWPTARAALVGCWTKRAETADEPITKAEFLAKAIRLDHRDARLLTVTRPLAAALDTRGDEAVKGEDWTAAWQAYSAALSLDPSLAWTRRKAEEARDQRLGIVDDGAKK